MSLEPLSYPHIHDTIAASLPVIDLLVLRGTTQALRAIADRALSRRAQHVSLRIDATGNLKAYAHSHTHDKPDEPCAPDLSAPLPRRSLQSTRTVDDFEPHRAAYGSYEAIAAALPTLETLRIRECNAIIGRCLQHWPRARTIVVFFERSGGWPFPATPTGPVGTFERAVFCFAMPCRCKMGREGMAARAGRVLRVVRATRVSVVLFDPPETNLPPQQAPVAMQADDTETANILIDNVMDDHVNDDMAPPDRDIMEYPSLWPLESPTAIQPMALSVF